jgi:hypothetical protein
MSRTYRLRRLTHATKTKKFVDKSIGSTRIEYELLVEPIDVWRVSYELRRQQKERVNDLYPPSALGKWEHPWTRESLNKKEERIFFHRAERTTNRRLLRKVVDLDAVVFVDYKHRY